MDIQDKTNIEGGIDTMMANVAKEALKEVSETGKNHIMTPEAFDQYKNATIGGTGLKASTLYNWQSMQDLAERLGRQITPEDVDSLVEIDNTEIPEPLLACPVPGCTHKMDAEVTGIIAKKIDYRNNEPVNKVEDALVQDGNGIVERGRFVVRIRKDEETGNLIPEIQNTSCPDHRGVITMVPKKEGGMKPLQERSYRQAAEHRDRLAADFAAQKAARAERDRGVTEYQKRMGGGPRNNSDQQRRTFVHSTDPAENRRALAEGRTGGKRRW